MAWAISVTEGRVVQDRAVRAFLVKNRDRKQHLGVVVEADQTVLLSIESFLSASLTVVSLSV